MFNEYNIYRMKSSLNKLKETVDSLNYSKSELSKLGEELLEQIQFDIEEIFEERKGKKRKEISLKYNIIREITRYCNNQKLYSVKIFYPANISLSVIIQSIDALKIIIGEKDIETECIPKFEDLDELDIYLYFKDDSDENKNEYTSVCLDEI